MLKVDLSSRDRKDIEKFTKYFVYKFVQTVVQSRQGLRIITRSKQFSSSDWFNLSIIDQPDILEAIKQVFGSQPINLSQPLCVEISLQTVEKETMILEYWYLQATDKLAVPDSSFQAAMAVYNNISVLLKSLITVTRLTPAYHLSRQQSLDTYSIRYDIRFQEPTSCPVADDCFRRQVVGTVPSPLGAINALVVYRTKLSISPQQVTPDLTSTIKDDYFNTPPCQTRHVPRHPEGAMQASGNSPGSSPSHAGDVHGLVSSEVAWSRQKKAAFGSPLVQPLVCIEKTLCSGDSNDDVAEADLPFASLLRHAMTPPLHIDNILRHSPPCDNPVQDLETNSNTLPNTAEQRFNISSIDNRGSSLVSAAMKDDFVMVEIKAPFAGQEDELGRFYRDCQSAPALSLFEQTCSLQQMLGSINEQLAQFEASAEEFNEFVNSLQDME